MMNKKLISERLTGKIQAVAYHSFFGKPSMVVEVEYMQTWERQRSSQEAHLHVEWDTWEKRVWKKATCRQVKRMDIGFKGNV